MSSPEIYRCEMCGNIVVKVKDGGGTLVCCGQPMTKLEANSVDASKEKHVPVVEKVNGGIKVTVGSALHPMLPEHHIQWIALVSGDREEIHYLCPGMQPTTEFKDAENGTVYAYCNLHGLWKTDF